jgi:hypothetical protein
MDEQSMSDVVRYEFLEPAEAKIEGADRIIRTVGFGITDILEVKSVNHLDDPMSDPLSFSHSHNLFILLKGGGKILEFKGGKLPKMRRLSREQENPNWAAMACALRYKAAAILSYSQENGYQIEPESVTIVPKTIDDPEDPMIHMRMSELRRMIREELEKSKKPEYPYRPHYDSPVWLNERKRDTR